MAVYGVAAIDRARVLNESPDNIYQFQNILLLISATLLAPAFVFRMSSQSRKNRPVLIPNSLWSNAHFSGICIMVFLAWAVLQGSEVFVSLL